MKINPIEINEINSSGGGGGVGCSIYNGLLKSKQSTHSINTPSTPSTNCLASSAGSSSLSKQVVSSPTSSLFNENQPPRAKIKSSNNYLDIFSYHDKISELLNETMEHKRINTTSTTINNKKKHIDRRSYYDNNQLEQTTTPPPGPTSPTIPTRAVNDIELLLVEGRLFVNCHY